MRSPRFLHRTTVWAALGGVVLATAIGASLIGSIRHAFGRSRRAPSPPGDERDRIRKALAGITVTIGPDDFAWLPPLPDDFDREAFFASLPALDPPLSQTIVDMRDEEA